MPERKDYAFIALNIFVPGTTQYLSSTNIPSYDFEYMLESLDKMGHKITFVKSKFTDNKYYVYSDDVEIAFIKYKD